MVGFAGVAGAIDIDLSMTTTSGYDDNIFRTEKDKKDDATFRFGPTVRFRDETSKLNYRVSYNPVYEKFVSWTDADAWSHFANGAVDYQLSDRTLVSLSENFRFAQSLNRGPLMTQSDAAGNDLEFAPDSEVQRDDIYLNTASAAVFHNFTAHTKGEFTVSHNFFDSERKNTSKNNTVSGFANVMHALTARDQLGLGAGTTWQRFEGVRGQPQTDTFIFRITGSWIHNFGQDTELTVKAGPAVIYTDQDTANTGSELLYPSRVVRSQDGGPKSISAAYATLGLDFPNDAQDLDGNPLQAGDMIGSGSVLIPEDAKCRTQLVGGQTVFDRSACSFNVVVDVDDPTYTAIANSIASAGRVNLNYVSGNGGGSDTRVTAFGEISISHHWFPELSSSASYVRSDSGATSLGSSTILDRVTVKTTWTPTRRWDLQVRGDWLQRKSSTDISNTYLVIDGTDFGASRFVTTSTGLVTSTTNTAVNTEYWRVSGRIAYRTSRRSTVTLRASYHDQDTERATTRSNSSFKNVLVFLGFRYDLDPFHF
ncbi:MAG: hypothetical protein JRE81_00835 [Deltaproteobacteria bacterium]|nr:hypothetical protein [Deltaproteobacteria bacterium]